MVTEAWKLSKWPKVQTKLQKVWAVSCVIMRGMPMILTLLQILGLLPVLHVAKSAPLYTLLNMSSLRSGVGGWGNPFGIALSGRERRKVNSERPVSSQLGI